MQTFSGRHSYADILRQSISGRQSYAEILRQTFSDRHSYANIARLTFLSIHFKAGILQLLKVKTLYSTYSTTNNFYQEDLQIIIWSGTGDLGAWGGVTGPELGQVRQVIHEQNLILDISSHQVGIFSLHKIHNMLSTFLSEFYVPSAENFVTSMLPCSFALSQISYIPLFLVPCAPCGVPQVLRRFLGLAGEERQSMLNLLTGTKDQPTLNTITVFSGRHNKFACNSTVNQRGFISNNLGIFHIWLGIVQWEVKQGRAS